MKFLLDIDLQESLEEIGRDIIDVIPNVLAFLAILIIGYFVAKVLSRVVETVLERVGFDRAVERGGLKRTLAQSRFDASDILGKIVFYAVFLFVLTLAFDQFGDNNPISELLADVIAFLPKVFAAILIIVVSSAIAAAVRELVSATLGGLTYGKTLANIAGVSILVVGFFAALNQIEIAPEIVNGLFYAVLALVVGSAIIAIGGGGIQPMRAQWERALQKLEQEVPRIQQQTHGAGGRIQDRAAEIKQQAQGSQGPDAPTQSF